MPINERKELFSCKFERFNILSMTMAQETPKETPSYTGVLVSRFYIRRASHTYILT